MIAIGKKAPNFTLTSQNGKRVRLSDFTGEWIVLYFYPKDDTPGCTTEACEFTSGMPKLRKLDSVVLGCSPDNPESHRAFIKKHRLKVTLLSDPTHEVMKKYEAWGGKVLYGKTMVGVIRSTVIIDPNGKVAYHWRRVKSTGHADKVIERLRMLNS